MIKSITIDPNFILHNFFGDKINFTDGVNVIYGPNGSGKSLLLKTLAYNTFIIKRGWSERLSFSETGFIYPIYNFDMRIHLNKKEYGQCILDWDGVACFRNDGILSKDYLYKIQLEIMCGMPNKEGISTKNIERINKDKLSSGQTAKVFVDTILSLKVPDLCDNPTESKYGQDYENLLSNYLKDFPRDGKPTLLIDELDAHFDFDNLFDFWKVQIPILSEKYQIIIVTHNPFFLNDTMNIIGKEYYEKSINLLKYN